MVTSKCTVKSESQNNGIKLLYLKIEITLKYSTISKYLTKLVNTHKLSYFLKFLFLIQPTFIDVLRQNILIVILNYYSNNPNS